MAVCNMNRTITLKVLKLHTTVRTLFRDELSTDTLLMGVYKKKKWNRIKYNAVNQGK